MRFRNRETPTFAGSNNTAAQGPDVVEVLELVDRNENVVASFTKDVAGGLTLLVDGDLSVTGDAAVSGNVTEIVTEAELSLSDNTTANASTTKHGFLKKLSNVATEFMNGVGNWVALTKSDVGLGNVDNTADASKPVSTATQTALDLKAPIASPTFTGTVSGISKSMVGLGNVDNTSDANKPVSSATQTALNLKLDNTPVAASEDGAITAKQGVVVITKAGVAALTIADPTAGDDDYKVLRIIAVTAHAHTLDNSAGSGFNAGGAGADVGTFGGAKGDNIVLMAYQGDWFVLSKVNVTLG